MNKELIVIAVLMATVGCGTSTRHFISLTEQSVIEIARKEMLTREPSTTNYVFETKRNEDGTWLVEASRVGGYGQDGRPHYVVGGDRSMTIDDKGHVREFVKGL